MKSIAGGGADLSEVATDSEKLVDDSEATKEPVNSLDCDCCFIVCLVLILMLV
jgi:hypothetical protein